MTDEFVKLHRHAIIAWCFRAGLCRSRTPVPSLACSRVASAERRCLPRRLVLPQRALRLGVDRLLGDAQARGCPPRPGHAGRPAHRDLPRSRGCANGSRRLLHREWVTGGASRSASATGSRSAGRDRASGSGRRVADNCLAVRLDYLVDGMLRVVGHSELEPQVWSLRRRYVGNPGSRPVPG